MEKEQYRSVIRLLVLDGKVGCCHGDPLPLKSNDRPRTTNRCETSKLMIIERTIKKNTEE